MVRFADNSGTWGSGGMFNAVARLSSKVPETYEAAHEANDLHLSDLHLIPVSGVPLSCSFITRIPSNNSSTSKTFTSEMQVPIWKPVFMKLYKYVSRKAFNNEGKGSVSGTDATDVVANAGTLRFVGVAVIQTYDRRRKVPRSDISMSAFETCLRKVVTAAKAHSGTLHPILSVPTLILFHRCVI